MDNLLTIETRYRDHEERTATVNREGWKRPHAASHPPRLVGVRLALAQWLTTLAARLAPPTHEPQITWQ